MPRRSPITETTLPEIDLDAFVAQARRQLEEFEKTWRANHDINPEHWPMSMPGGDWDEQLVGFDPDDENFKAAKPPGLKP